MSAQKRKKRSKGFRNDSLLYFAQRVNEMLSPKTDHIFRAPVLNTDLLVEEYLKTEDYVSSKTINPAHLNYIIEEFQYSFGKDIVVERYIEATKRKQILQKFKKVSIEECKAIMEYVRILLSDYNKWCKDLLFELIEKEEEINKIEQCIRCIIPGLVSSGYSTEFIYNHNINIFIKHRVNSLDSLRLFLNRFDFANRTYDVYIAIDAGAKKFQDLLKKRLRIEFGPFPNRVKIRYNKRKFILVKAKVVAFDEFSAARTLYKYVHQFFLYYCFLSEQAEQWFHNEATVIDSDNHEYIIPLKPVQYNRQNHNNKEYIAKATDFIIMALQNKKNSYIQLNRVLNMHNTAINDSDIMNLFLDLWSILEILFVYYKDKTKILEVIDKMIPVLQKDYLCFQFSAINAEIRERERHMNFKIIEEQFPPEDKGAWPYYIVALDQYSNQLQMLYKKLRNYPLLRYRIKEINNLCKDKNLFLDVLEAHKKRITWHIARLYRARNTIAHSGEQPDNLSQLVEHLHSYTDQCFYEIVNILVYNQNLKTIPNALVEVLMRVDIIKSILNPHLPLSKTDLVTILKYS